jgi:hypothetical protein
MLKLKGNEQLVVVCLKALSLYNINRWYLWVFSIQSAVRNRTDRNGINKRQGQSRTCSGQNKIIGHRSRRDLKPRMTVLARASRNLTDRPSVATDTVRQ